ncbi:MAG: hypothetical protein Q4A55_06685 [Aerococcus sp.]|nr:hypothetical protein [Aerococcus sp.]
MENGHLKLWNYERDYVRLTLKNGKVLEGVITDYSSDYDNSDYAKPEDTVDLDHHTYFESDIAKIERIEPPADH